MNKIIKGTYTYYYSSNPIQEEIDLTLKLLNNVDIFNKNSLLSITSKVLELPINEQIHFIHYVTAHMYSLQHNYQTQEDIKNDIKNENIETFLAQEIFNNHRDIILACIDNKMPLLFSFENILNIKIQITN